MLAATPGYPRAIHARLAAGRFFDAWQDAHQQRVVVLGSSAAGRLGITWIDNQSAIFIGGTPFAVIGIVDDTDREAGTLLSAVVPAGAAEAIWGTPPTGESSSAQVLIDTDIGAARQVGGEAPLALRPEDPHRFRVITPPDPRQLREGVHTYGPALKARRSAALDRTDSKTDRSSAATDRSELAEDNYTTPDGDNA